MASELGAGVDSAARPPTLVPGGPRLGDVLLVAGAVAIFWPAMEWLFFATKPSFLATLTTFESVTALLVPPLVVGLGLLPFTALAWWLEARLIHRPLPLSLALLPATVVLASTGLVMADNFTTTVFGAALARTRGAPTVLWTLALLLLVGLAHAFLRARLRALPAWPGRRALVWGLGAWALVGLGVAAWQLATVDSAYADVSVRERPAPQRRPNILLISSDAVEARWMSLYGFPAPTTPFLERFAATSLVADNAFTNAGKTTGATLALVTGQAPWHTRAGYPPQVLRPEHAFEHLPAMLRKLGYRAAQRTVRYYADASDLNLLGAFSETNLRRRWPATAGTWPARLQLAFNPEGQLLSTMLERAVDRVLHVSFLRPMTDAFLAVTRHVGVGPRDDLETVAQALAFIRAAPEPYFLQLHFMGTHPGDFHPAKPHFTAAELPAAPPDLDSRAWVGMLNALRDNDTTLAALLEPLAEEGRLDDTVVIFTSDHSQTGTVDQRLPLLVRFPRGEHAGHLANNAQLLDVAPTLVDYLGLTRPEWMVGRSLLDRAAATEPPERGASLTTGAPILSFATFGWKMTRGTRPHLPDPGPPLYGVREVGVVLCSRCYTIALPSGRLTFREIDGHRQACPETAYPPDSEVAAWAGQTLRREGYAVDF